MILTTTTNIEGKKIKEYLSVVTGTDIYLVGGVFGGGWGNQENLFGAAYRNACENMKSKCPRADAIIGIQVQASSPGSSNNMIVLVTGTAVKLEDGSEDETNKYSNDELPDF